SASAPPSAAPRSGSTSGGAASATPQTPPRRPGGGAVPPAACWPPDPLRPSPDGLREYYRATAGIVGQSARASVPSQKSAPGPGRGLARGVPSPVGSRSRRDAAPYRRRAAEAAGG